MTRLTVLLEEIQSELAPIEERIRQHPYPAAVGRGEVPRDRLRTFAGEQHHIIRSDLRSFALLLARYGGTPSRQFFLDMVSGENEALAALGSFAGALGMDEGALDAYEPLPGAQAYPSYVARLAIQGSDAEVAGAFLVNLAAWGHNCGLMSAGLREKYGLSQEEVRFFDLFAAPAPEFERSAREVIESGLAAGVQAALIKRAARLLQSYELMYWDALHEASKP